MCCTMMMMVCIVYCHDMIGIEERWTEAVLLSKIDKAIKCSKKCFLKEAIAWNLLFQAKREKKSTIFTAAVKCKKKVKRNKKVNIMIMRIYIYYTVLLWYWMSELYKTCIHSLLMMKQYHTEPLLNWKEFYEKKMQQDFGYLVDFSNSLSRFFNAKLSLFFDNTWMCTINEAIIMQRYRQV